MQTQFFQPNRKLKKSSDSHYLLFLSLMLLLLAFFILLSSLSVFEQGKSKEVFNSIGKSFLISHKMLLANNILTSLEGKIIGHDPVLKEIGELFRTALPLVKIRKLAPKTKIALSISKKSIWNSDKEINSQFYNLLDRIYHVLRKENNYKLYVLADRKREPYGKGPNNLDFLLLEKLRLAFGERFLEVENPYFGISFDRSDNIIFTFIKERK